VIAPKHEELRRGVNMTFELLEPWIAWLEVTIPEYGFLDVSERRP
jgi:hypothetical protein